MKSQSLFALMLGMLLVLGACSDKLEPNKIKDNQQNEQNETPSSEGNEQDETPLSDGDEGTVGGHAWVNLGLPSGTLWATCNVGANSPEEYGDHFAWGETTPKPDYNWISYKYASADDEYDNMNLTKYCHGSDYGLNGFEDFKYVLDAEDDVATANWGNGWRMPTFDEIKELKNKCSSVWTTQNGKNGRLFTGPNGKTLFLPAAGYYIGTSLEFDMGSAGSYWSSTLDDYPDDAYSLRFYLNDVDWCCRGRCYGRSVRPVVR